jgi:serine/threonine protein phosphatase PrpC
MCDASAAVALDADHFVVANDERNTLRIYKRGQPDPVNSVELSTFLGTNEKKESDLEGAARIGTRVYWISSHGRNKDGELQERRRRFFATEITSAVAFRR